MCEGLLHRITPVVCGITPDVQEIALVVRGNDLVVQGMAPDV